MKFKLIALLTLILFSSAVSAQAPIGLGLDDEKPAASSDKKAGDADGKAAEQKDTGVGNEKLSREELYNKIEEKRFYLDTGLKVMAGTTLLSAASLATVSAVPMPNQLTSDLIAYVPLGLSAATLLGYYIYSFGILSNKGALYDYTDLNYEMAARYQGNPYLQRSPLKETQAGLYSGTEYYNSFRGHLIAFALMDFGILMLIPRNDEAPRVLGRDKEVSSTLDDEQSSIIGWSSIALGALFFIHARSFLPDKIDDQGMIKRRFSRVSFDTIMTAENKGARISFHHRF